MFKEKDRLASDARKWLPKPYETTQDTLARVSSDVSAVLMEQRHTQRLEERVNTSLLFVDQEGNLADFVSRQKVVLREESVQDALENFAVQKVILPWILEGKSNYLVWISPPSGEYIESRLIVYRKLPVRFNGKPLISYRAICSNEDANGAMRIARQIAPFAIDPVSNFETSDDLRATPINFEPGFNMDWTAFLSQFIDPKEIWERIKNGQDWEDKFKAINIAEKIVERKYHRIITARSFIEFIEAGAEIERMAQYLGFTIQRIGGCGISNIETLRRLGIFDKFFLLASEPWVYKTVPGICQGCHTYREVICGFCKKCGEAM